MPQFDQLQSPYEFTSTSPNINIADVVDAEWNFDPEMHEHFSGSTRHPRYSIGNDNTTLKIKTTDKRAFTSFIKGMEVTNGTIKFKSPVTAVIPGTAGLTQSVTIHGFTISNARVVEAIKVSNGSDKKPAEFEIMLRASIVEATGATPTLTFI